MRLDPVLVEKALELDAVYTGRLLAEAKAVTGLENPNSGAQLSRWLETKGLQVTSLDKKAVPELLAAAPDDSTRRALQLRQELAKTSVKKYEAMRRGLCEDGRVLTFSSSMAPGRTGRWAGTAGTGAEPPQNKLPARPLPASWSVWRVRPAGNGLRLPALRAVPAHPHRLHPLRGVPLHCVRLLRHRGPCTGVVGK